MTAADRHVIDPKIRGRVALVTGANHGIGAATAISLARLGARVFLTYLRNPIQPSAQDRAADEDVPGPGEAYYRRQQQRSARSVVERIRREGGEAQSWETDLGDPAQVPVLFERAEDAFGVVEILVNNAAYCRADTFVPASVDDYRMAASGLHPSASLTPDSHDRHFAVNSRAPALTMAEFARRHVAHGHDWGRIINVSTDGASGFRTEVSYGASKHALESYSRAAAQELGPFGVTVNVVSPGAVQTGWMSAEVQAKAAADTPLGRTGDPEDIADAIVFFASEQARWITGQLLYVGGGHVMPL